MNAVSLGVIKAPAHDPASYKGLDTVHPLGRVGEISDGVDANPLPRASSVRHRRDAPRRRRAGSGRLALTLLPDLLTFPIEGLCTMRWDITPGRAFP